MWLNRNIISHYYGSYKPTLLTSVSFLFYLVSLKCETNRTKHRDLRLISWDTFPNLLLKYRAYKLSERLIIWVVLVCHEVWCVRWGYCLFSLIYGLSYYNRFMLVIKTTLKSVEARKCHWRVHWINTDNESTFPRWLIDPSINSRI